MATSESRSGGRDGMAAVCGSFAAPHMDRRPIRRPRALYARPGVVPERVVVVPARVVVWAAGIARLPASTS
jgi:hypothetical protein